MLNTDKTYSFFWRSRRILPLTSTQKEFGKQQVHFKIPPGEMLQKYEGRHKRSLNRNTEIQDEKKQKNNGSAEGPVFRRKMTPGQQQCPSHHSCPPQPTWEAGDGQQPGLRFMDTGIRMALLQRTSLRPLLDPNGSKRSTQKLAWLIRKRLGSWCLWSFCLLFH